MPPEEIEIKKSCKCHNTYNHLTNNSIINKKYIENDIKEDRFKLTNKDVVEIMAMVSSLSRQVSRLLTKDKNNFNRYRGPRFQRKISVIYLEGMLLNDRRSNNGIPTKIFRLTHELVRHNISQKQTSLVGNSPLETSKVEGKVRQLKKRYEHFIIPQIYDNIIPKDKRRVVLITIEDVIAPLKIIVMNGCKFQPLKMVKPQLRQ